MKHHTQRQWTASEQKHLNPCTTGECFIPSSRVVGLLAAIVPCKMTEPHVAVLCHEPSNNSSKARDIKLQTVFLPAAAISNCCRRPPMATGPGHNLGENHCQRIHQAHMPSPALNSMQPMASEKHKSTSTLWWLECPLGTRGRLLSQAHTNA